MRQLRFSFVVVSALAAFGAGCGDIPTLELLDLAQDGNFCEVDADCCVIVDECRAEAFIVTADEFEDAKDIKSRRNQEGCAGCTVPTVAVTCERGACVGKAFDPTLVGYDDEQALDSCGPRAMNTDETNVTFATVEDGVAICGDAPPPDA